MASNYYYAITNTPLPETLHGTDASYAIRILLEGERLAIEDYFFSKDVKVTLIPTTTAVVVAQSQAAHATLEEFAVLVEFSLGIVTSSGFQPITMVAILNALTCSEAVQRSFTENVEGPVFLKKISSRGSIAPACKWIGVFFTAQQKTRRKLNITAYRFVR